MTPATAHYSVIRSWCGVFLLVDEGALVRAGKLPEDNLAALLFRLEHNRGIEDVRHLVLTYTQGAEHIPLRRAFFSWIRYVLLPRALPDINVPPVDSLLEVDAMLAEHSRSWTHQWKMEGRQEGLEEGLRLGRQEGRQEGEAAVLMRLLERKFGAISDEVRQRVQSAAVDELETWSLNILGAASIDDVF